MRISAKGEYAIRSLLDLAQSYESDEVRTLEQISHEQAIPHNFLVQILLELKRAGLVESRRGSGGGYRLTRPPKEISLGEVIRLVEGPLLPFRCNNTTLESNDCVHHGNCVLSPVWNRLRGAMEAVINHVSFAELAAEQERSTSPMFHI